MIASIVTWMVGKGVSEKLAKLILFGGLAAFLIVGFGVAKCAYDRSVITNFTNEANLEAEERARGADEDAAGERLDDANRLNTEEDELEGLRDEDPDKDTAASDADRAYLRCIRLQQRARIDGKPVPACSRPASGGVDPGNPD